MKMRLNDNGDLDMKKLESRCQEPWRARVRTNSMTFYSAADANGKVIDPSNYWLLYAYKEGVVEAGDVARMTMAEGYLRVVFQDKR